MAANKFQFVKPKNWKIIKAEKYKDFSILSPDLVPCIYGFAIEKEQGYDVVSMFDYGESSSAFFQELTKELEKLKKNNRDVANINDYLKENASDFLVTETKSMKPLFYKAAKIFEKTCFVNIMEITTNLGKSYSLQIFVKLAKNLVCFGTSVTKIDVDNPFKSLISNYRFIDDLVNVMIRSVREVN